MRRNRWQRPVLFMLAVLAQRSAAGAEGRWEGLAQLPGQGVPVVIDLARSGPGWTGSATLPGRGVALAPLRTLEVGADGRVRASLAPGGGSAPGADVVVTLQRSANGRALDGQWQQGGHSAPLRLSRSGPAQQGQPQPEVPLAAALTGTWRGRYDIGLGPREVTLRITPGSAAMTIVGRRTYELVFDERRQVGGLATLHAREPDITVELPWASAASGQIDASWLQGPFGSPLKLEKEGRP